MRKLTIVLVLLTIALACVALAQAPQQPPAGAAGGRGGGAQRGMAQVPPATGPMLDVANKIAEAINKQDAATLTRMLAPDVVYLDEDGHAPPASRWVMVLTSGTPPKHFEISNTHGQMFGDTGWVSFNYVLG